MAEVREFARGLDLAVYALGHDQLLASGLPERAEWAPTVGDLLHMGGHVLEVGA